MDEPFDAVGQGGENPKVRHAADVGAKGLPNVLTRPGGVVIACQVALGVLGVALALGCVLTQSGKVRLHALF